jgi:hypothetical protein
MRHAVLRTLVLGSIITLIGAQSAEAQGNWRPGDFGSVRFRLGLFEPTGDPQYWEEKFNVWTGSAADLEDVVLGVDYLWRSSGNSGVLFGSSFYNGDITQGYREWVDADGNDVLHTTELDMWDFYAVYIYRLGGRGSTVTPYIGGGAGFVYWELSENGYFIDFDDPDNPVVVRADYWADGWTWEGLAVAGLDVSLGYQWSFILEGRYRWSDDELAGDFAGFGTLDLSGPEVSAGFAWNF